MLNDLKFPDPKGNIVYKVVCVLYFFRPFHLHTISPLWNFLNKNIKKEKEIKVNNSLQSAITSCKNPRYIFFKSFVNGQCTCTMCVYFLLGNPTLRVYGWQGSCDFTLLCHRLLITNYTGMVIDSKIFQYIHKCFSTTIFDWIFNMDSFFI